MNYMIKVMFWFGVAMFTCGVVFTVWVVVTDSDVTQMIGSVILFANAAFFWFAALMLKIAPGLEFMGETPETSVDRGEPAEAMKETLEVQPPPKGMHIPGPSYWPIFLAIGGVTFAAGFVFDIKANAYIVLGGALAIIGGAGWVRQNVGEQEELLEHEDEEESEGAHH